MYFLYTQNRRGDLVEVKQTSSAKFAVAEHRRRNAKGQKTMMTNYQLKVARESFEAPEREVYQEPERVRSC